ncbi:MAG: TonB-dependent receptor [Ignavibacteriaceae bacterium]|nr:TonB-dependent receptor [Ignavibacteriaceae bacterium]
MRFWLQFISILILSVILSTNAFSQTGKIAGKVLDAGSKEPIVGANVVLVGTTMGAATDLDGTYTILDIAPGVYTVRISAVGYQSLDLKNVRVSIDFTTREEVSLRESAVQVEAVVVTAEKPLVQKDLTSSTATINNQDIQSLPVTSMQDVLQLQAGIVKDQNGDLHFRGGRKGEVSYWIDGVPVTDSYDGSTVVDINKNSIQEMQLVTGAFNAEYGQAMSGIVNIATKSGGSQTHGMITAYAGSYVTGNSDVFMGLQKIRPLSTQWVEGSLSGPIASDKLTYYMDARYYYNAGDLYGQRKFNTWDISNTTDANENNWIIQKTGNNEIVPMAPFMEAYIQGKLTYKVTSDFKISYDYILNNSRGKDYDFSYKYNPDGELSNFKKGYLNTVTMTDAVSSKSYFTLGLSYFFRDYREYLDTSDYSFADLFTRKDPFNQNYVNSKLIVAPESTFLTSGTNMAHNVHNTDTYVIKFDFTSQITQNHEFKTGFLFNQYKLYLHNINLHMSDVDNNRDPVTDGKPFLEGPIVIPTTESTDNISYEHKPWQFSFYAQDKMEYNSLIINLGLRFDYFHPDGQVLSDPSDPNIYLPVRPENQDSVVAPGGTHADAVAKRMTYWYKNASDKWQVSPRLGVAFPITERGVVHFSYGLFFQIPDFSRLYENAGYKLPVSGGSNYLGIVGNPDLQPEQTTSGELGLQQQLTDDIAVDITAYFRDIRNLAGTLNQFMYVFGGSKIYSQYVNADYGFIRGVVVSLTKRFGGGVSAALDYTYQIAKGNESDPTTAYNLMNSGKQAQTELIPLDWDQTHTVNLSVNYTNPADWGASFIFQYGSGTPYTPQLTVSVGNLIYNSEIKPATYDLDFRVYKDFRFGSSTTLSVFLRVNNLLDTKNATQVYTDTGQPDWSLTERQQILVNPPQKVASITDWYTKPYYYSEPRRVEFGTTITF